MKKNKVNKFTNTEDTTRSDENEVKENPEPLHQKEFDNILIEIKKFLRFMGYWDNDLENENINDIINDYICDIEDFYESSITHYSRIEYIKGIAILLGPPYSLNESILEDEAAMRAIMREVKKSTLSPRRLFLNKDYFEQGTRETARRWVTGKIDIDINILKQVFEKLKIKSKSNFVIDNDDINKIRFAISRCLSFIYILPGVKHLEKIPCDDHFDEYSGIWNDIKTNECYYHRSTSIEANKKKDSSIPIINQTIFDKFMTKYPDFAFPVADLGRLKKEAESATQNGFYEKWYMPFVVFKYATLAPWPGGEPNYYRGLWIDESISDYASKIWNIQ